MKAKRFIFRLLLLIAFAACVETLLYLNKDSSETTTSVEAVEESVPNQQPPTLDVKYTLKEDDLHLQLAVTHFSFSLENMGKDNRQGEGHVHLYVDGKKVAKVFEPTYVLKDIAAGKHEVMVELAHNNHETYGVSQRFQIEVKP